MENPNDSQIKRNKRPHLHREESILLIGLRPEQHAHALKNLKGKDRAINGNKEANDESAPPGRPPSPPAGELGHIGRPWPSPADAGARPSHGRAPVGAGDPQLGPRQPVLTILGDVLTCLDDQTISESYETRTVASVSKIASQRLKNHVNTTSVLREKPRKTKEARPKGRTDDAWPTPEPPNRGARP